MSSDPLFMDTAHTMKTTTFILCLLAGAAIAQPAQASDFPADATTPDARTLQETLAGNVFMLKLSNGLEVRLEYNRNGYFFYNNNRGLNDKGTWETRDGQICSERSQAPRSCTDVRLHGDRLLALVKVGGGTEIVPLTRR